MQGIGNNTTAVEDDLGRAYHVQTPVGIYRTESTEGFHHRLLYGLGMIYPVDDHVTVCQYSIDITCAALIMGTEITFIICADSKRTYNSARPEIIAKAEDYLKKESIAGQVFITGMLNRNFSLNEEICAVGFECKENLLPFAVFKK